MSRERPPDSVVLDREYDGTTSTLRAVRHDVVGWLRGHTTDADLEDRLALVVSELATNAIQASPGTAYALRVSLLDGSVVMTLTSSSGLTAPPPRETWGPVTAMAPNGRGLLIVDRMTDGVDVEETLGGKIMVTATFRASSFD
ncbi:MAG: ATP-binding protein [Ilumatobacteraceae bacterium]